MRKNIDVYIYIYVYFLYTKNSDIMILIYVPLGRVLLQFTMKSSQLVSFFFWGGGGGGSHKSTHMALMEWSSFFKFKSWTK